MILDYTQVWSKIKLRGKKMKTASANSREAAVAEELWLNYLNKYLFEHNIISAKEYELMTEIIAVRCSTKKKNR